MSPIVSVIIPCYNQAHFLRECIASLQSQTYQNWEAIIVNDGSPDNTDEVSAALCASDARVRYIEKSNGGLSSARNAGLKMAKGSLIQFLDADDLLEKDKFRKQIEFLINNADIDLVYGNALYFCDDEPTERCRNPFGAGEPADDWITQRALDRRPIAEKLIYNNMFAVCCPLIRLRSIEQVGLFNESLTALEDWEYWVRCASIGLQFYFFDEPETQAIIRVHSSSMTHDNARMNRALVDMQLSNFSYIDNQYLRFLILSMLMMALNEHKADRKSVLKAVLPMLNHWDERVAYLLVILFGHGTLMHEFLKPLLKMLPWRWRIIVIP